MKASLECISSHIVQSNTLAPSCGIGRKTALRELTRNCGGLSPVRLALIRQLLLRQAHTQGR